MGRVPRRDLVAVIFDDASGAVERRLSAAVAGDVERDPADISRLTDWARVAEAHKAGAGRGGDSLYDVRVRNLLENFIPF